MLHQWCPYKYPYHSYTGNKPALKIFISWLAELNNTCLYNCPINLFDIYVIQVFPASCMLYCKNTDPQVVVQYSFICHWDIIVFQILPERTKGDKIVIFKTKGEITL